MSASLQAGTKSGLRAIDPPKIVVISLLLLVIAVGFAVSDRFGTVRNFMNVIEQAAALGFVSLGQTIVVLAGGIDLSVGAIVTAATVFMAAAADRYPEWMPLILLAGLAGGTAVGALNGLISVKTGVHPLIVTLGMATILNGIVFLYTLQPNGGVPTWFEDFAYGRVFGVPVAGLTMFLAFLLVGLWLHFAAQGRAIRAVGGNPEAARLVGIRADRVTIRAYAASGFLAVLAGAYFLSRTGVGDPRVGDPLTLASITPVIVGGTILGGGRGGVVGTLLGVFLMSLLNNLLNYMNIPAFIQWAIQGLLIIVVVSIHVSDRRRL